MREGLEVSFLAHLEGTPTRRHTGYSPALAALWCTGCIKIVEVIMYAGRLGMSFLAHLEGTPTGRHRGYSPALAPLWCTGRVNIVEMIMYAGRLGSVFFGAPGRYAYWAP